MASASLVSSALKRLQGKVALVTGAASGIGECTARLFSKQGAKLVIADVQDELGRSVCRELDADDAHCSFVHCDVTAEEDVQNAVNTAVSKYGKLDIMFNNAGPFLGTKHAARVMIPNRRGSIITTASICSVIGGVASHAYTSSKHGVVGLMKNTAVELGQYGIRVNCVSPYVVATPLAKDFFKLDDDGVYRLYSNLKEALLKPEDVAQAALYLASDDSQYVSGHNLVVDGGFTVVNPVTRTLYLDINGICDLLQIILSQEKSIFRLNELVRTLRQQLLQCRCSNETKNSTFGPLTEHVIELERLAGPGGLG
ncbi:hypothetical protein GH714_000545 [Hevea brasiliensis]|uniref:Ketoreductase (KR) domain-containing protein n=1 Tax=Hevea brasiliensis TaxID=3981 RepID=A0A6A6N5Z4_HEVBR|nr:hypothetical protein GH714_000545 [Hevea brasiliensis]